MQSDCPMHRVVGTTTFVTSVWWQDVSFPHRTGPLSIKRAYGGSEEYRVDGADLSVSDATYLILNQDQEYAAAIDPGRSVETFCLFFERNMAERIGGDIGRSETALLDEPNPTTTDPITFHSSLRRDDELLSPRLERLRRRLRRGHLLPLELEEESQRILVAMMHLYRNDIALVDRLPAKRAATRFEQFRRVHRGRDWIEGNFRRGITIEDAARAACLSSYHFIRLFKEVFATTPGRYVTERRLEEARRLLRTTTMPIAQVCESVGFESLGTFAHLFRRRTGLPPAAYRRTSTALPIVPASITQSPLQK